MSKRAGLEEQVAQFVKEQAQSLAEGPRQWPEPAPEWSRLSDLGTSLWLDTGSLDESAELWNGAFQALTTNNTLLNQEVQRGQYDTLVSEAARLLRDAGLDEAELRLELAFILNAVHGLRLVDRYDAFVSVEEHTDLAHDAEAAVRYARRYHEICPERFIIKIPLTPAGLIATRRVSEAGIPVNHTLGFSARQNYVIARIGRPEYVNVFMGRLNSFVADNELGDGRFVGEKATLASQAAMRLLRDAGLSPAKQIGASLRGGEQIRDLAGLDVLTMPPKAAKAFLDLGLDAEALQDATGRSYTVEFAPGVDPQAIGFSALWDIGEEVVSCTEALGHEDLSAVSADQLVTYFREHGCGDLFPGWTDNQVSLSAREGKIPALDHWKKPLAAGDVGLDSLLNLAGLNSFVADQAAMDRRVADVLSKG